MDAVVVALKERIAEETAACWQELQALDVVLSDMSEGAGRRGPPERERARAVGLGRRRAEVDR